MKPMFEIKVNTARNAIMLRAVGKFDVDLANAMAERFKEAVLEVSQGFTVITDMSEFKPMDATTRAAIGRIVHHAGEKGIGCAVRILSRDVDSQIGGMQLDKESRDRGYPVFIVRTYAEARKVLGWDDAPTG